VLALAAALGRRPPPLRCPVSAARALLRIAACLRPLRTWSDARRDTLETWVREDVFEGHRFQKDFRYQTEVPLKEGIRRQVDWRRRSARLNAA
jgi:hypothetical protein